MLYMPTAMKRNHHFEFAAEDVKDITMLMNIFSLVLSCTHETTKDNNDSKFKKIMRLCSCEKKS